MTIDNPLTNPGTSKVFLSLVNGKTYPKAISDFLNIQPPPVIEQLRRLKNAGLVKLGTKDGRKQNYDIIWSKIIPILIEEAIHPRKEDKNAIIMDDQNSTEKIRALKDSDHFKDFIKLYLRNISDGAPSRWYSITEAMDNFESALAQSKQFNGNMKFEDTKKQNFFEIMKIWHKKTLSSQTWLDLNFHDALHTMLKE